MTTCPLPAHKTKHLSILTYPLPSPPSSSPGGGDGGAIVSLVQDSSSGTTSGSTLWLGAQVLSFYLPSIFPPRAYGGGEKKGKKKKKLAVELGAGVGLTSLVLANLGFGVFATDLAVVVEGVLAVNVARNRAEVAGGGGGGGGGGWVEVRELDWRTYPGEEEEEGEGMLEAELIVTADTVYEKESVAPLVKTIKKISRASKKKNEGKCPLVLVSIEVRDQSVVEGTLEMAREEGFECRRVSGGRIKKCLDSYGVNWEREDWAGVQIWRLRYKGD